MAQACPIALDMKAPDLPGHGRSPAWDGLGDYHRACVAALRGGMPERGILVGHSFGATLALRLALEAETLPTALILIEPVLFAAARGSPEFEMQEQADAAFGAKLAEGDTLGAAAAFLDQWGTGHPFAAMPEALRTRLAAQMPLIAATAPALFDDNADLLAHGRLEALDCPVLLIRGEKSPPIIGRIHDRLSICLPQSQQVNIAGVGHMAAILAPGKVGAAMGAFLQGLK